jgi:hypothetical protein
MQQNMLSIHLGGGQDDGVMNEPVTTQIQLMGCSCRVEDFLFAVRQFAKLWIAQAESRPVIERKPCGCVKDADQR